MGKTEQPGFAGGGATRRDVFGAATTLAMAPLAAAVLGSASAEAADQGAGRAASTAGPFWPHGARLAIAVTLVVETGAEAPPALKTAEGGKYPDLFAQTADEYATREGIPRALDLFDRRGFKATALVCGQSAEKYPDIVKEIAERGHECAGHGKTHASQYQMTREDERAFIQGAAETLQKVVGRRPVGWNCRAQQRSPNTLSLLQELGFLYHVDDVSRDEPFLVAVDSKPFVVVPYTQHLTDFSFFTRGNGSSAAFEQELKLEFDALYAEAARRRRMMAVTLHDSVARPARVQALENFFAYAQGHPGVWATRADEIAAWAKSSPATITDRSAI